MNPNAGIAAPGGLDWVPAVIPGAVFADLPAWIVAGVPRRVLGAPVDCRRPALRSVVLAFPPDRDDEDNPLEARR